MKELVSGKKQPLLMIRRSLDRLCLATLLFGLLLLGIWAFPWLAGVDYISKGTQSLLSVSSVVLLTLSMFSLLAGKRAYVQVQPTYLCLVTPLLRLNISFKRLRSAHPALVQQLFPPRDSGWARRAYLRPFYGKTAVVVELKGYPLNPVLLRLFFTRELFSPQNEGLVLLVPDWMAFSTELDTLHGKWLGWTKNKELIPGGMMDRNPIAVYD